MGVFPRPASLPRPAYPLPHARGGVSQCLRRDTSPAGSSPRTWGCFLTVRQKKKRASLFPTHVGVFPIDGSSSITVSTLPHARGGVSCAWLTPWRGTGSSPRTWGCFWAAQEGYQPTYLFPTHVGVFPEKAKSRQGWSSLPHARGGVSKDSLDSLIAMPSSPRTWGCFWLTNPLKLSRNLFPTCVGVFPPGTARTRTTSTLPHARGGVSKQLVVMGLKKPSSPRTWGCFYRAVGFQHHIRLSLTYTGNLLDISFTFCPVPLLFIRCLFIRIFTNNDRKVIIPAVMFFGENR